VKLRLEGNLGTSVGVDQDGNLVIAVTEVQRVEHHTEEGPKPDGWTMTDDGQPIAVGPEKYLSGHVEFVLGLDHAQEFAEGILQGVTAVRKAQEKAANGPPPVDVPKRLILPGGIKLPGNLRRDGS
jgi:hypothetical protein